MARASILWLIGEYCEHVPKIAPDVLRKMAKTFTNEEDIVKLQIINLAAKLYLTNSKQVRRSHLCWLSWDILGIQKIPLFMFLLLMLLLLFLLLLSLLLLRITYSLSNVFGVTCRLSCSRSMYSTWQSMTKTMTFVTGLDSSANLSCPWIRVVPSTSMQRNCSLHWNLHLSWSLHLKVKIMLTRTYHWRSSTYQGFNATSALCHQVLELIFSSWFQTFSNRPGSFPAGFSVPSAEC